MGMTESYITGGSISSVEASILFYNHFVIMIHFDKFRDVGETVIAILRPSTGSLRPL